MSAAKLLLSAHVAKIVRLVDERTFVSTASTSLARPATCMTFNNKINRPFSTVKLFFWRTKRPCTGVIVGILLSRRVAVGKKERKKCDLMDDGILYCLRNMLHSFLSLRLREHLRPREMMTAILRFRFRKNTRLPQLIRGGKSNCVKWTLMIIALLQNLRNVKRDWYKKEIDLEKCGIEFAMFAGVIWIFEGVSADLLTCEFEICRFEFIFNQNHVELTFWGWNEIFHRNWFSEYWSKEIHRLILRVSWKLTLPSSLNGEYTRGTTEDVSPLICNA